YAGDGSRPNTLTWCLTINGASLSKDMAQRCVIVKVARPVYSATWEDETSAYVEANRWAILGDLIAVLKGPAAALDVHSRWGAWEDLGLARLPGSAAAQELIAERQDAVDEDREAADLVREGFAGELKSRGHDPGRAVVFIPMPAVAAIVIAATGE